MERKAEFFVDGHHGIYVPMAFAQGIRDDEIDWPDWVKEILLMGPEHPEYWDAWVYVLDHCTVTYAGGRFDVVHGDSGDVWLIPDDWTTEEYDAWNNGDMV